MAGKKTIPFSFVTEYLHPLPITVKPFFGCYGVYTGDKIVMILRQRTDHPEANGIWIATERQYHQSLKQVFPSMRSIAILNEAGETSWQMIPADAADFESSAIELCTLIRRADNRIGRIPRKKSKKKSP